MWYQRRSIKFAAGEEPEAYFTWEKSASQGFRVWCYFVSSSLRDCLEWSLFAAWVFEQLQILIRDFSNHCGRKPPDRRFSQRRRRGLWEVRSQ